MIILSPHCANVDKVALKYVSENPTATETANVKLTVKYLEACNKLFEKGF